MNPASASPRKSPASASPADGTVARDEVSAVTAPVECGWPGRGRPHSPLLGRNDLERRLALALKIAGRTISLLGQDGYRDEAALEDSFGPDKPLAETAMLLHAASAVAQEAGLAVPLDELAAQLARYARTDRVAVAIALHPTICLQLAMPHILLTRLGIRDERFDRVLGLSLESSSHRGREVVPHRTLEALWLRSLIEGELPEPTLDSVAKRSAMSHRLDLLWGSRDDAYAYTHTFMYFTDFGYRCRPLPEAALHALDQLEALLARSLLVEDFDLAAETLMIWPMASVAWSPVARFGFRVLAELEDRVGFLPSGNGVPERFSRLEGLERTRYALAASYHTAYVMGMLCALSLRPGHAGDAEVRSELVPPSVIGRLLDAIPVADTPWQRTFRNLDPCDQQALAPFLLDVALLDSTRKHDFGRAAGLLETASNCDVGSTVVCTQVRELMDRVCGLAGVSPM